ncbi:MAG: hypothetical protein JO257_06775 [Deltaproteobacteria bacterium]|nr:hypothetical protein [Deltaproteobacteria bacterium]
MRLAAFLVLVGCAGHHMAAGDDQAAPDAAVGEPDAGSDCVAIDDQQGVTVSAGAAGNYVLAMTASASSPTSWGENGNEAVVLEVSGAHGLIGHLILHEGKTAFGYAMEVGKVDAGETLTIRVSELTAVNAVRGASVCGAALTANEDEGVIHAPIYRWPVQKTFNDVPLVVGWSKAKKSYQTVMTNEDGGTAEQCGGGASGMQAEIARWGRSTDIESHYGYGGAAPTWERCTGRVDTNTVSIRTEDAHPILYYGDGHNRVFENRSGYGSTCGTGAPEKPDGDLAGWNTQNPSSALADDAGRVVVLRPVPFDLDALGYAQFGGRREALSDRYAPWIYRIASLELAREGKIDNSKTFGMSRYLYVDVRVADVGGSGDSYCSLTVSGGFKLRAVTSDGAVISSGQMTSAYTGTGHDWKRVAIALPAGVSASDIDHFVFDAYDNDGIYVTAIGDAFVPTNAGLAYVRQGVTPLAYYVDDGSSGCVNGTNSAGPGGTAYECVGGQVTIAR